MRGSVVKKGNRYYVVVNVPTADGIRRQKWHAAGSTRKEAERALVDIVGRLHRGVYVNPTRVTVGEFFYVQWLPAVRADIKLRRMSCTRRSRAATSAHG